LYDIHNRCSKCPSFAMTQAKRRLGPMPFHTSVTVATQQSWSKSCGLYCMGRAPGASLHTGEDPDCGGVAAAHYRGVWMHRSACHRQCSEAVA